ncbi:MAG: hypothetical protein ACRDJ5_05220 [Actinomycetota bacterium]
MIRTSYLRVYLPLEAFSEEERRHWLSQQSKQAGAEQGSPGPSEQWLMRASLPSRDLGSPTEGAFVRHLDGAVLVCPWRTRLRMLAGLLAFRSSVPDEVAEAFVPDASLERAEQELTAIGEDQPALRSHIIHANWHVPLRWFVAFDDLQRILVEDKHGLRVRYEAPLVEARSRLAHGLEVLESAQVDEDVTDAVRELVEWIQGFPGDGLLELDYGGVARSFEDEELVDDHSAAEVGTCLEALEAGDMVHAARIFVSLTEKWSGARSTELVN